jgi:hypothetical protein
MFDYMQKHPGASEEEAMKHILKFSVQKSVPGSPSWHRNHLQDLQHAVSVFGMPDLFLTLTCDEVSDLKWEEIAELCKILNAIDPALGFGDAPCECARIFHHRLWTFLHEHIILPKVNGVRGSGMLGEVLHYLVRYEVQGRGSLHCHIILWINPNDLVQVSREICAYVPGHWDPEAKTWTPPAGEVERELFNIVLKKQMHVCREGGCCAHKSNVCSFGFPFPPQPQVDPVFNPGTKKYEYCRLNVEDRNVVPYHPSILLLWNAHMNLQRVTNEAWSFYILKYALKTEPMGKLNLKEGAFEKMHVSGLTQLQMKAFYALYGSKPMSACEIALDLLEIPTIFRDFSVDYIPTPLPKARMKRVPVGGWCRKPFVRTVDKYMARPVLCEEMTLLQYVSKCQVIYGERKTYQFLGLDALGNHVYKLPENADRLVRFTDYHPGTNPEGFAYNLLLGCVPFRSECELLSHDNSEDSYLRECFLRGVIKDEEDLEHRIHEYCARHLYSSELTQKTLMQVLSTGRIVDCLGESMQATCSVAEVECGAGVVCPDMLSFQSEFQSILDMTLTEEQQVVLDAIVGCASGVHVIRGVPGAGKTLLAKKIAVAFQGAGKVVLLAASTGPAACRLSCRARTVHAAFQIPPYGALTSISPGNPVFQSLLHAHVILIDEYSMLTKDVLHMLLYRLSGICATTNTNVSDKCIVFLGDPAQLPPVCHCRDVEEGSICKRCHVTSSPFWGTFTKHFLNASLRHSTDPSLITLLGLARSAVVPQECIDQVLGDCMMSPQGIAGAVDDTTTFICTHRVDVATLNQAQLERRFPNFLHVPINHNCESCPELMSWVEEEKFHDLTGVAVGAPVMLTNNLDLTVGACNGATGTVAALQMRAGKLRSIQIVLHNNVVLDVYRMVYRIRYHAGARYFKSTFPVMLAFAMTGHKCQGATLTGKVVLVIKEIFCPGLLYVMLSRVLHRSQLLICGKLVSSMFCPIPGEFLG